MQADKAKAKRYYTKAIQAMPAAHQAQFKRRPSGNSPNMESASNSLDHLAPGNAKYLSNSVFFFAASSANSV